MGLPEPVEHLGLYLPQRGHAEAGDHHEIVRLRLGKRLQVREPDPLVRPQLGPGRAGEDPVVPAAAVGLVEDLDRTGQVQDLHVGTEDEDHPLHGRAAFSSSSSSSSTRAIRAKRLRSTASVRRTISSVDSSEPSGSAIGKVAVASVTKSTS